MRGIAAKTGIPNFVSSFTEIWRRVRRVVALFGLAATPHVTAAQETAVRPIGATPTGASNMTTGDDEKPPTKFPGQVLIREAEMDGRAVMYVQTVFWVASYVRQRSAKGDVTQEQLIEEFALNVRQSINPEWRPDA